MANRRDTNVSTIEELKTVGEIIVDSEVEYRKLKNKELESERRQQEITLAKYRLQLEKSNIIVTKQMEIDFLNEYETVRKRNAERSRREEERQRISGLVNYYKENSKLADKENKKKDQLLKQELDIAKLRSKIDATTGVEKTPLKGFLDNISADLKENNAMMVKSFKDVGGNIFRGLVNIGEKLSGEINSVISSFSQYQSTINTRLQGTATTFQTVERRITQTLGMSPFVRTSSLLESLNDLVAQGIAFNIEQRSFLNTISDKISTTFDAANASLLRIVRLQQADTTASRLGMESYLTRFFNEMFQDTSYLSDSFDSVTAALIEATSQMTAKQAVEFEYVVQKWLGSLTAVGTSQSTIQSLAEALGYLGAGNINALSGSSMQNLLVMAASRAGLDYSSILTEGLNAYKTNTLLNAVVGYMQEIGGSGSQVVRSQFAQTFGLSISDLTAAKNLGADLENINRNMMSYTGTIQELGYQLGQIVTRVSVPEQVQNIMANIKFGIGQGIAQSPILAGMWAITDLIQSVTGGIAIPAISVMGNMVNLNTTVENLIKTGLVGASTLGKIGDLFTGLRNARDMGALLDARFTDEATSTLRNLQTFTRGSGLAARDSGMSTSMSTLVGTSSGSEISSQALSTAMAGPQERQQQAQQAERGTTSDIFNYLVYLLDPKVATMTRMLGTMAGYNVGTSTPTTQMDKQSEFILGMGTSVTVGSPTETMPSKQFDELVLIKEELSKILGVLESGINVTVSNISSLVTGTTGLT
jgi:hypothetical protein